ncbi:MAG: LptE family protein [Bacteroidales bacterium]|nr:LptE family protein [Bacteroidales bacterium]
MIVESMVKTGKNDYQLSLISLLFTCCLFASLAGCKVSYSFTGASVSPEIKTISVQYFPNRSRGVVNPTLSQDFTDALKDRFKAQTSLELINGIGDVNFEGEITNYRTQPMAITGTERAALTRFTISISVKYSNIIDPEGNFDATFSRYEDFESSIDFSSVEADLVEKILDQITEDVFNRAFVNW